MGTGRVKPPLPDPDFFAEIVRARNAEIDAATMFIKDELLAKGERELAARLLELGILQQNLQSIYQTMLIAWIDAS